MHNRREFAKFAATAMVGIASAGLVQAGQAPAPISLPVVGADASARLTEAFRRRTDGLYSPEDYLLPFETIRKSGIRHTLAGHFTESKPAKWITICPSQYTITWVDPQDPDLYYYFIQMPMNELAAAHGGGPMFLRLPFYHGIRFTHHYVHPLGWDGRHYPKGSQFERWEFWHASNETRIAANECLRKWHLKHDGRHINFIVGCDYD